MNPKPLPGQTKRSLVEQLRTPDLNHGLSKAGGDWFWPLLERYRDPEGLTYDESQMADMVLRQIAQGRTNEEIMKDVMSKRWRCSPATESRANILIGLIETHFPRNETFTYLEFGICLGTTIAKVLGHFQNAKGLGLEIDSSRLHIARFIWQCMNDAWRLERRLDSRLTTIEKLEAPPRSIDVVFMDTNHLYPDDYNFIRHILASGWLKPNYLFVGDDPFHTGTDQSRRRFIDEFSNQYQIVTRRDWNLWWFSGKKADAGSFQNAEGAQRQ